MIREFNTVGTCNLLNKRRFYPVNEQQKDDEDRFKLLLKLLNKLSEIEAKKNGARPSTTQNNFFCSNPSSIGAKGATASQFNNGNNGKPMSRDIKGDEFLQFTAISTVIYLI